MVQSKISQTKTISKSSAKPAKLGYSSIALGVMGLLSTASAAHATSIAMAAPGSADNQPNPFSIPEQGAGYQGLMDTAPMMNSDLGNLPRVAPTALEEGVYAGNKVITHIKVALDANGVPADGQTATKMSIKVYGKDGQQILSPQMLTVQVDGARLRLKEAYGDSTSVGNLDADPVTPGIQVRTVNGEANVWVVAPHEAKDVPIRVSAGDVFAEGRMSFVPEVRPMIVAGLVEGVISFGSGSAKIEGVTAADTFEREISHWSRTSGNNRAGARAALFLKGKVLGSALLTAAYDSEKDTTKKAFRDIRPDEYYPVYGDNSIVGHDAKSQSKLYVRLDKDKHYLLYGDIELGSGFSQSMGQGTVATVRTRDLGNYNRSLVGARAHYETQNVVANVYAAQDKSRNIVEEFSARGVSGPYGVSNSVNAIQGSEKVEIIVRDRNQPSIILKSTPQIAVADYYFEPFSGRILFKSPIPSVDSNLNPISIRVSYEVEQEAGDKFWVYGADGQVKVGNVFEVGGSYVKDKNPYKPFEMTSANATVKLAKHTAAVVEVAKTKTVIRTLSANTITLNPNQEEGQAWRAELLHDSGVFKGRLYAGHSDVEFNNPASSLTGGRNEAGLQASYQVTDNLTLQGKYTDSKDLNTEATRKAGELGASYKFGENLVVEGAVTSYKETAGVKPQSGQTYNTDTNYPLLGSGLGGFNGINPATGQSIASNGFSVGNLAGINREGTGVRLGARYQVNNKIGVFGEVEQDVKNSENRRFGVGADYRVAEWARLYGRYEAQTGLTSASTLGSGTASGQEIYKSDALVVGVETQYMEGGDIFSEYRMRDSQDNLDATWATGLRNTWRVNEKLKLSGSAEHLKTYKGATQQVSALTGGAEYRVTDRTELSGRVELRKIHDGKSLTTGAKILGGNTAMVTATVGHKLNRDWTSLGKLYWLNASRSDNSQKANEGKLTAGVAYRPVDHNKANLLAKYEYWTRSDASGALTTAGTNSGDSDVNASTGFKKHIVSVHGDYHPSRPWLFSGRAAAKLQTENFKDGHSEKSGAVLLSGRATYDVTERIDVGVSAAVMKGISGGNRNTEYAAGVEAGYQVMDNLWLSAGYNFRGFKAPDLTGSDYTAKGAYVRVRFKFDEDLFSGNDPEVNRALPRKS